jgi:hypothetical protein
VIAIMNMFWPYSQDDSRFLLDIDHRAGTLLTFTADGERPVFADLSTMKP